MTNASESPAERDWIFVLDMAADVELVLRTLAPFPGEGAQLRRLNLQTDGGIARLEIQVSGLQNATAERLGRVFQAMSGMQHVSFGTRLAVKGLKRQYAPSCATRRI